MAKLKLLTNPASNDIYLSSPWVRLDYADYFDLERYDPNKTYSCQDSAIIVDYVEQLERPEWYRQRQAEGFRIIIEHLGDSDVERTSHVDNGVLTLRNPNWMWYHACQAWSWFGLDNYQPNRSYQYSFLMPMNAPRWHRDRAIRDLKPLLPDALYSYCANDRELPGTPPIEIPWRIYMNPMWYDSTPYTVVSESYMRSTKINHGLTYRTEVSEKIFKPMAGHHPFIVYGSVDTLKYLHNEGFATYDNLFDESYDTILDNQVRFEQVTQVINQAVKAHNYQTFQLDSETQQRIAHNRNRLFDRRLVTQRFQAEVVGDILRYLEQ